jgi:hypothetical protein
VVVSASKGHLVVHDLTIKTAELMPLSKVTLVFKEAIYKKH